VFCEAKVKEVEGEVQKKGLMARLEVLIRLFSGKKDSLTLADLIRKIWKTQLNYIRLENKQKVVNL
jgi:hypothetical protein